MRDRGFTLIEIVMVVAVFAVLITALSFAFIGWQGKYKVESQVKSMYSDLMDARVRAMRVKRTHFFYLLSPTSYTMYDDDADGANQLPDGDGTLQDTGAAPDTQIPTFPRTVEHDLNLDGAAPSGRKPQDVIGFNARGLATTSQDRTICVFTDSDGDGESDSNPDFDCIVISQTRTNIGQFDPQIAQIPGNCNNANCIAK